MIQAGAGQKTLGLSQWDWFSWPFTLAAQKAKTPTRGLAFLTEFGGRPCGIRTCDQRIKSPLLYQLS